MTLNTDVERLVRATSSEEAKHALTRSLSREEAEYVLRNCVAPELPYFAEMAGERTVEPLLENRKFKRKRSVVVRSWIDALTEGGEEIGLGQVAEALASLAERGYVTQEETDRIAGMLCKPQNTTRWMRARTAIESRIGRFPFTRRQLLAIVERRQGVFTETAAYEIATHPKADAKVWHALLGTGFMNLRALSQAPKARRDPVVRERLMKEAWDSTILAGLCADARGSKFRELWIELLELDEMRALEILKTASPDQLAEIPRAVLQPLLMSPQQEVRLAVIAVIGQTKAEKNSDETPVVLRRRQGWFGRTSTSDRSR